jgi:hypothetical protein
MQTISSVFERELAKLIAERRKTLIENVASGLAVKTFEQYREAVGRIDELREVEELMAVAAENVSKR